jgi:hypothetical protein
MGHVSSQAIGAILAHYSDVIEGGTTWRGSGTSFRGIPGTYSNDAGLRSGADTPLTSTGSAATTTFAVSGGDWASDRWVKTDGPGYFAVCTSATNTQNVDAARRITGWNNTTKVFTVDAFPAATTSGDVFAIRQGFKRLPNGVDLEAGGAEFKSGFDRYFELRASPGEPMDYHGAGTMTYRTTLDLRLRLLKYGRQHDIVAAALENLAIIRPIICRGYLPDHRETTYTRALIPMGNSADVVVNDDHKVIVRDEYTLIYRVDTSFN